MSRHIEMISEPVVLRACRAAYEADISNSGFLPGVKPDAVWLSVRLSQCPEPEWVQEFDMTSSTFPARVAADDVIFAVRTNEEAETALGQLDDRIRQANERYQEALRAAGKDTAVRPAGTRHEELLAIVNRKL